MSAFWVGTVLPTHWFLVARPAWSYWQGHFIDYWAPKLYVSSVLLWILWAFTLFWVVTTRYGRSLIPQFRLLFHKHRTTVIFSSFIGVILVLQQIFSNHPQQAFVFLLTVLTGPVTLALWIMAFQKPFGRFLTSGIMAGVLIQAVLAWYQFFYQASLGGYWLLGQPQFLSYLNLETSQWFASGTIRFVPYGSTPHPNVLGTWIVVGILLFWKRTPGSLWPKSIRLAAVTFLVGTILLTESWSALLSLCILAFLFPFGPKAIRYLRQTSSFVLVGILLLVQLGWYFLLQIGNNLLIPGTHHYSWERRSLLLQETFEVIKRVPQGTGLNQHWTAFSLRTLSKLGTFLGQPVHNFAFYLVADLGIWVLFLIITFLILRHKNYSLIVLVFLSIIPSFSLDHFAVSTISGQYILVIASLFLLRYFKET